MQDFKYRTEDISLADIPNLFVESLRDRSTLAELKATSPVVLVGSRGVGKSFLLRVSESQMNQVFPEERVLPVYVTFRSSSLVHTSVSSQFHHWMLSRLCSQILRELNRKGLLARRLPSLSILSGSSDSNNDSLSPIEKVALAFEDSWKNPGEAVDIRAVPSIDDFKDAVEDLCEDLDLRRISVFFDEAAHVLIPDQQRQFFTLFRDLRSPRLTCNAAVYPGVTAFGDTFQPIHDARMIHLDREVTSQDYVDTMREMVIRQADSQLTKAITTRGQNFSVMAYAASGNPRVLLKTIAGAPDLRAQQVNEVIRDFYRNGIWAEHSLLAEKYGGHRDLIDWGRKFIEGEVLPELQKKNHQYLASEKNSTAFFWIHRDAPQPVKEALRLLAYTGIVSVHDHGMKATRSEIGTRYSVNLGCLFAFESAPANSAFEIARSLTPKRMSEYGANHPLYSPISKYKSSSDDADTFEPLKRQLNKPIDVLDITNHQKDSLHSLGLNTIRDVLLTTEEKLKEARYIGDVRARKMMNAAFAPVFEYLSG